MLDFFAVLKNYFKARYVIIDSTLCRLHYKASVGILIAFSLVVTGKQYIGDPIDCISKDSTPSNLLDTYCWIHKTFSIPSSWKKVLGDEVAYPGVAPSSTDEKDRVYHAYYQWVCFVLFLQALFFYIPRFFWKSVEGKKVENLTSGLVNPIVSEGDREKNRQMLVDYLYNNRHCHKLYFASYVFTELWYFINVVVQIFIMDRFLGGEFTTYGPKVLEFTEWDWQARYDPMLKVFPRVTKCTFRTYGTSGDIQKYDAMCILPINIINEKVYVFLWFWFVIVAVITGLLLLYRLAIIVSGKLRYGITMSRAREVNNDNEKLQVVNEKGIESSHYERLKIVLNGVGIGDWFLIDLIARNIESFHFKELIHDYAAVLDGTSKRLK